VNKRINKKQPTKEVIIPIITPSSRSVLFSKRGSNYCWQIDFIQIGETKKNKKYQLHPFNL
jgi:hypothetical protein